MRVLPRQQDLIVVKQRIGVAEARRGGVQGGGVWRALLGHLCGKTTEFTLHGSLSWTLLWGVVR